MRSEGRFLFLGTGASTGVPLIGCRCAVCTSTSPYNQRLRPSGLLLLEGKSILIDAGPDFRAQALTHHIDHIDGLLLTHTHYDHIGGIDELRVFYFKDGQPIDCLLSKASLDELKSRFAYLFRKKVHGNNIPVQFVFEVLPELRGEVEFLGLRIAYMTYRQGGMLVSGFRVGDLAYILDIRDYPSTIFEDLAGVKTLVVSALRHESSYVHFSVEEAVEFARQVGAEQTWLTHIAHDLDHEATNAALPPDVQLAHDGLEVGFQYKNIKKGSRR